MKQLPEGFLWGGATADFQYEGGFNEGGRGLLSHDFETDGSMENPRHHTMEMNDGSIIKPRSSFFYADPVPQEAKPVFLDDEYYPSHQAVDFYHRYKEDIALMAEMGFNVFRFSICWSRIYPLGDEETPNQEGIEFYRDVFKELRKYNIKEMDALHIAFVECGNVDYMITTDKKLINASKKSNAKIKIFNPVKFIMEVNKKWQYQ